MPGLMFFSPAAIPASPAHGAFEEIDLVRKLAPFDAGHHWIDGEKLLLSGEAQQDASRHLGEFDADPLG
ncbi:MAG: hypothetical protein QM703_02535 [Gemmatales bacterium]